MIETHSLQRHAGSRRIARHAGMIMAVVLVTLLLIMLLGAGLVNAFLTQRQSTRDREQRQQSVWLADSAVQRARYRLDTNADYEGETWEITPEMLNGSHSAVAEITIETVAEPQPGHRLSVEVIYPNNGLKRNIQRRERFIPRSSDADT